MAVCRGGIALWVGCIRSHGSRQCWSLTQVLDPQRCGPVRGVSSASWALVPPNSLRYQNVRQPSLSHPFHHATQPQPTHSLEEDSVWEDSVSVCVLVGPGESDGQHTLVEVPLFGQTRMGELLAPGPGSGSSRPVEFLFPLTTVDGRREDDINVGKKDDERSGSVDFEKRERGSFRSLFQTEGCPAPFMYGSTFYCFHCPEIGPSLPGYGDRAGHLIGGLGRGHLDLTLLLSSTLSGYAERQEGAEPNQRQSEEEEKMAVIYEKLRVELPNFFIKGHDYSMYSSDMEFINGLLNSKTRGRALYQFTLSMWRILCLCYYAEARLEVLKLTKHMEDGTIKARWRIRGLPFHSLLLRFYKRDKTHLYRMFDAFSTFYIGHDGLIHCHKVEKVMQAQPPVLPRVGSLLAGALVALGVQDHRPALNLLPLLLSSILQGRN